MSKDVICRMCCGVCHRCVIGCVTEYVIGCVTECVIGYVNVAYRLVIVDDVSADLCGAWPSGLPADKISKDRRSG